MEELPLGRGVEAQRQLPWPDQHTDGESCHAPETSKDTPKEHNALSSSQNLHEQADVCHAGILLYLGQDDLQRQSLQVLHYEQERCHQPADSTEPCTAVHYWEQGERHQHQGPAQQHRLPLGPPTWGLPDAHLSPQCKSEWQTQMGHCKTGAIGRYQDQEGTAPAHPSKTQL